MLKIERKIEDDFLCDDIKLSKICDFLTFVKCQDKSI